MNKNIDLTKILEGCPSDCNIHIDYIVDAKFTKEDVIDMFCNENKKHRVVVVCKCFLITNGSVTYEQTLS